MGWGIFMLKLYGVTITDKCVALTELMFSRNIIIVVGNSTLCPDIYGECRTCLFETPCDEYDEKQHLVSNYMSTL